MKHTAKSPVCAHCWSPAGLVTSWPSPAAPGSASPRANRCPGGCRRRPPARLGLAPAERRSRNEGPRYYDWAWTEIGADGHRHLLIRRNPSSDELAFYLCWSLKPMPLSELVRVAGTRWCIEECFQAAKGQVGLDHYQVRHWTAWHRHITLAMLALAFLAALAADATPQRLAAPTTG